MIVSKKATEKQVEKAKKYASPDSESNDEVFEKCKNKNKHNFYPILK
jgi:hypothetical protein